MTFLRLIGLVLLVALLAAGASSSQSPTAASRPGKPASPPPLTSATGASDVWLEAVFEPAEVYVQAQAIYALRLYQAIDVRELRLEVPAPALAELRPLREDKVAETTRDGRRYRVTERRFAVFPFASGEFTLSGARAVGTVAVPDAPPETRAALEIVAPRAALSVLPIPPEVAPGAWLPARALSLAETWTSTPQRVRVGEALQRTIRIEAHGLDAAQLPPSFSSPEGFSVHPAPPRLDNRFDGEWNVGVREESVRLVPSRGGELIVPEVRIYWWDAVAGRPRLATLPAHTFSVAGEATADGPDETQADVPGTAEFRDNDKDAERLPADGAAGTNQPRVAQLAALAAVFAALAATVSLLHRHRQGNASLRALRSACRRNDPRAARAALLLHAAGHRGSPVSSLGELAAHVTDAAAHEAIMTLDRHLYGVPAERWDGRKLFACIPALGAKAPLKPASGGGGLPPLYPDQPPRA